MKRFILIAVSALLIVLACACAPRGENSTAQNGHAKKNTVIFVTFGSSHAYDWSLADAAVKSFNTSETGVKTFFFAESLGKLELTSVLANNVPVEDRASPYRRKSLLNPDGYDDTAVNGLPHIECFYREQMLVRQIVESGGIPKDYNPDGNGDGVADAITFVFDEKFTATASSPEKIMWPHKSEFYGYDKLLSGSFYIPNGYFSASLSLEEAFAIPEINGVKVGPYAVVSTSSTEGEVCHELSHVLGLPDYYSYEDDKRVYDNLGGYELLGAEVGAVPQYSLAYVRSKLGWLEEGKDVLVTDSSAAFTLSPVTENGVQAVKVIPADFTEKGEFFMIEARRKGDSGFDSAVNSTGVIIYSVVPEYAFIGSDGRYGAVDYGNMYGGGRFEVKLFTNSLRNYFTGKPGSTALEDIKYRDGSSSGVSVTGITANEDGSFSFGVNVTVSDKRPEPKTGSELIAGGNVIALRWEPECEGKTHVMVIRATPTSAACFMTGGLPKAKSVAAGNGEGLEVIEYATLSSASREYIPRAREECYLLVVHERANGELYGFATQHLVVAGVPTVTPQFSDFIGALLRPGRPLSIVIVAFIACCVVAVSCVLVGITVKKSRKRKTESAENP